LLLSPAVVVGASAVRLIVMSNYDTATATTIASSRGVTDTLLGTIVPLLPPYLPALAILFVAWRSYAMALLTCVGAAFVSPFQGVKALRNAWGQIVYIDTLVRGGKWGELWNSWTVAVGVGLIGLVVAFVDPPRWTMAPRRSVVRAFWQVPRVVHALAIFVVCLTATIVIQTCFYIPRDKQTIAAILRRPWVPSERITLKNGHTLVGYTLTTKDDWQVFLVASSREIQYIPDDQVVARQVCELSPPPGLLASPLIRLSPQAAVSPGCYTPKVNDTSGRSAAAN
jgi:hypothetical protein